MLKWITFAPLIGAVINGLFGRRLVKTFGQAVAEKFIGAVAAGSVLVSAILSFISFNQLTHQTAQADGVRRVTDYFFTWLSVGAFRSDFAYLLDPLSGIYVLFITGVGFLIHVYATGYMKGDPGFYRFFAYLNLFMFMMLTLVLADNLLLLFVGWEGVGLCSYLLIGYYIRKKEAGDAAKKAFIVNRVGDFSYSIGMFLIFTAFGSISFVAKDGVPSFLEKAAQMPIEAWGTIGLLGGIALLLFGGATGKSAQIPLFVWLPDAMAGPTPVSALIHAATMVTAGVYMVVSLQRRSLSKRTDRDGRYRGDHRLQRPRSLRQRSALLKTTLRKFSHIRLFRSLDTCSSHAASERSRCGDLSRDDARVLQGAVIFGFGFSHSRYARGAGYPPDGRVAEVHADYVHHDDGRMARDLRLPAALGLL